MSEEKANETIAETVEKVAEETVEAVEEAMENSVPPLLKLKSENPALFFGGIAGVVVAIVLFMLSGDEDEVGQHKQADMSLGSIHTLQAPNSLGASNVSLKILKIPGQMSAFDNDDDVTCNAPIGTSVTVRGFQDAFGTSQMFVQVEINQEIADCRQGVKGWTLKNNLN